MNQLNKIDNSEQWLLEGKCHICRKRKYCSKPCTKCKNRREHEMRNAVASAMVRMMTGK